MHMSEHNKAIMRRFFHEVWSQGNLALVDELLARDWVGHAPPSELDGPAELKRFIAAQRLACPDLQVTVEDQVAEGDRVATRWTARAAPGRLGAEGRPGQWSGITWARLADGRMIEGWISPCALDVLGQPAGAGRDVQVSPGNNPDPMEGRSNDD
jgi:predicted SnoaL-like aldol condensation-catalyzing enzyme